MTPAEAIAFMVQHKILALKTPDGLEITLHPEALSTVKPDDKTIEVDNAELDIVGATGMTRREQIDLLGQTFETDFERAPVTKQRKQAKAG